MTSVDLSQQDVMFDFKVNTDQTMDCPKVNTDQTMDCPKVNTDQTMDCPKVPDVNLAPQDVLYDAKKAIAGPRREAYGNAKASFTKIARLWSEYLGHEISAKDVALMMALLKIAREQNAHGHDNLVDICGYAALAADCVN